MDDSSTDHDGLPIIRMPYWLYADGFEATDSEDFDGVYMQYLGMDPCIRTGSQSIRNIGRAPRGLK